MTRAEPLAPGSLVGRYAIVREIGRGGMCRVYEALHRDLHKTVAVKTLNAEYVDRPDVVERFLREGRAASRIRHRHVVDVVDVGQHEGVVYLAMEFFQGEDLSQRIKREGALAPRQAVDLALPVVAAIAEAHRAGVVHRDLKPSNVFLAADRHGAVEPKVLDFGISKLSDDDGQHRTSTEAMLGTPAYMAPEQIENAREVTPASDQYALGVILYQCLTGQLPFRGTNLYETLNLVLRGAFVAPRDLCPALAPALDAAVVRAMARDPAHRFASVVAMGAALLPFASEGARAQWAPTFDARRSDADPFAGATHERPSEARGDPGTITATARAFDAPAASPHPAPRGLLAGLALVTLVAAAVAAAGLWRPARPTAALAPTAIHAPPAAAPIPLAAAAAPPPAVVAAPATNDPAAALSATPRVARPRRGGGRRGAPSTERAPSGSLIVR